MEPAPDACGCICHGSGSFVCVSHFYSGPVCGCQWPTVRVSRGRIEFRKVSAFR